MKHTLVASYNVIKHLRYLLSLCSYVTRIYNFDTITLSIACPINDRFVFCVILGCHNIYSQIINAKYRRFYHTVTFSNTTIVKTVWLQHIFTQVFYKTRNRSAFSKMFTTFKNYTHQYHTPNIRVYHLNDNHKSSSEFRGFVASLY